MFSLYCYRDSLIHRASSGCKLLVFLALSIIGLSCSRFEPLLFLSLFVAALYFLAKVPSYLFTSLKPILGMIFLSTIAQTFFIHWEVGCATFFRLLALIWAGSLLTLTTSSSNLAAQAEKVWSLFSKWIPKRQVGILFALTMRLIPLLFREIQQIKEAQEARGVKVRFQSLIIPTFIQIFFLGDQLCLAIENRVDQDFSLQ